MRSLPQVADRDRFAACAYQVDKLHNWMVKRSRQLKAAGLPHFTHATTPAAGIISWRQ